MLATKSCHSSGYGSSSGWAKNLWKKSRTNPGSKTLFLPWFSDQKSCPTLCDPIDVSTPGFPVLHHLWELTQAHVHRVGDAIQPSHPLSSPSLHFLIAAALRFFFNLSFNQRQISHLPWPLVSKGCRTLKKKNWLQTCKGLIGADFLFVAMWGQKREGRFPVVRKAIRNMKNKNKKI